MPLPPLPSLPPPSPSPPTPTPTPTAAPSWWPRGGVRLWPRSPPPVTLPLPLRLPMLPLPTLPLEPGRGDSSTLCSRLARKAAALLDPRSPTALRAVSSTRSTSTFAPPPPPLSPPPEPSVCARCSREPGRDRRRVALVVLAMVAARASSSCRGLGFRLDVLPARRRRLAVADVLPVVRRWASASTLRAVWMLCRGGGGGRQVVQENADSPHSHTATQPHSHTATAIHTSGSSNLASPPI